MWYAIEEMKREIKILLVIFIIAIALITVYCAKRQPNDALQIKNVLQQEVPNKSGVKSFEIVDIKIINSFAKATIKPLDVQTDNAWVILQKTENQWKVIWGPGTDINPEDPIYKILPKNL